MKFILIILGSISLGLGILGIITPGLPTTPFLLLTAYLYARSSEKLYNKLLTHKVTGRYLNKVNTGFSLKGLIISITLMWCMIAFTAFVIFPYGTMRFVMLGLGVIGTISQYFVLRKKKKENLTEETVRTESVSKKIQEREIEEIEI